MSATFARRYASRSLGRLWQLVQDRFNLADQRGIAVPHGQADAPVRPTAEPRVHVPSGGAPTPDWRAMPRDRPRLPNWRQIRSSSLCSAIAPSRSPRACKINAWLPRLACRPSRLPNWRQIRSSSLCSAIAPSRSPRACRINAWLPRGRRQAVQIAQLAADPLLFLVQRHRPVQVPASLQDQRLVAEARLQAVQVAQLAADALLFLVQRHRPVQVPASPSGSAPGCRGWLAGRPDCPTGGRCAPASLCSAIAPSRSPRACKISAWLPRVACRPSRLPNWRQMRSCSLCSAIAPSRSPRAYRIIAWLPRSTASSFVPFSTSFRQRSRQAHGRVEQTNVSQGGCTVVDECRHECSGPSAARTCSGSRTAARASGAFCCSLASLRLAR